LPNPAFRGRVYFVPFLADYSDRAKQDSILEPTLAAEAPGRQDLSGQGHRLARLSGQPARAVHYRHGYAQPSPGFSGRSFPDSQKIYTEPSLLLVDELRYLSLDQRTSNLFYQVISTRHSHERSTLITTNTAFSDWGNILYNTTIATAIADRLVENSEIFLLGGESLPKVIRASLQLNNRFRWLRSGAPL
jgi:hypothetical protein